MNEQRIVRAYNPQDVINDDGIRARTPGKIPDRRYPKTHDAFVASALALARELSHFPTSQQYKENRWAYPELMRIIEVCCDHVSGAVLMTWIAEVNRGREEI